MASSKSSSRTTVDHDEIRQFVERRGGIPALVKDTGVLQIDFPGGASAEKFQHLSWDQFFQAFEQNNLALTYQEQTSEGNASNLLKFVQRETGDASGTLRKTKSAAPPHDTDDDAAASPNKDEDAKKKATKGTTARNNNDDDSKDKNPDTKGGMKTKDPAQRGGSERQGNKEFDNDESDAKSNQDEPKAAKSKTDKNDNKKSGKESPKKKSTDSKTTH